MVEKTQFKMEVSTIETRDKKEVILMFLVLVKGNL